jgi:hypothetical protein
MHQSLAALSGGIVSALQQMGRDIESGKGTYLFIHMYVVCSFRDILIVCIKHSKNMFSREAQRPVLKLLSSSEFASLKL